MTMPTPIRHDLDLQRREFTRQMGRAYEDLIARGIDPAPWMAAVVQTLEAVKSAAPDTQHRRAA